MRRGNRETFLVKATKALLARGGWVGCAVGTQARAAALRSRFTEDELRSISFIVMDDRANHGAPPAAVIDEFADLKALGLVR